MEIIKKKCLNAGEKCIFVHCPLKGDSVFSFGHSFPIMPERERQREEISSLIGSLNMT